MRETVEQEVRWQPVMLVITGGRVECRCGALASFVTGKLSKNPEDYNTLEEVDVWCQDCFGKAQEHEHE